LKSAREESIREIANGGAANGVVAAPKNNPPPSASHPPLKSNYKRPGEPGAAPVVAQQQAAQPLVPENVVLNDPEDAVIAPGSSCTRNGCSAKFADGMARTDSECTFHAGEPIFHEGSKGWTCCKRKVLDFSEFLNIEPCTTGRHKFIDENKAADEIRECRHDWYQTGQRVTMSIYAKQLDAEACKLTFEEDTLEVRLVFKDGKKFNRDFQLADKIVPADCSHSVLSTKVEIRLARAPGTEPWTELEK
jgi:CHORD/CS domain